MDDGDTETGTRERSGWFHRTLAGLLILLFVGVVAYGFHRYRLMDAIESVELKTYDFRHSLRAGRPVKAPSDDIILVKFDNRTLGAFGSEFGTWPWPRRVHADMIEFLSQDGARAIVYDMIFAAPQLGMAESDQAFVDAFRRYDNVYLIMNFDHEFEALQRIGRDFTYEEDVKRVEPLAIALRSDLDPRAAGDMLLGDDGFYWNRAMTFDHYQSLFPQLMSTGRRMAFVNHEADADGITRGTPLFYRLKYHASLRSALTPFTKDPQNGQWTDSRGRPVSSEGVLLGDNGLSRKDLSQPRFQFFPHMAVRMLLDTEYAGTNPEIVLTDDGRLVLGRHNIPLDRRGNFLVNWYNVNVGRTYAARRIAELRDMMESLPGASGMPDGEAQTMRRQTGEAIQKWTEILDAPYVPMPYVEVSAMEVIEAMREWKSGRMSRHAVELAEEFRDKIVFIGATATATYDMKHTSISSQGMPGMIVLATIFDNLRQNTNYLRRAGKTTDLLVTAVLCGLTALVVWRVRSAAAGVSMALASAALYAIAAVLVFRFASLWVNMALPIVALTLTTSVTFIAKYIGSDKAYRRAHHLATTDMMTGLFNHRHFQDQMRRSIAAAARDRREFSLVMLDIDHFKKFNDTHGHQAGDEVLRCVARKIKSCVRPVDVPARYGGEEMAVIFDRTGAQQGLEAAQMLVSEIAATAYPIKRGVTKNVTVSAGVATYPIHGATPSELIEFADAGLYRAKQNGRNQVGAQSGPRQTQQPVPEPG